MPNRFARRLRLNSTEAERRLWAALRDRRLRGYKMRRQRPIGPYIVDFVCLDCRLIVEADGGQHCDSLTDERRRAWLEAQGWRVIRFWNSEILGNTDGVIHMILSALEEPSPTPTPRRRGPPSPASRERV
jgi:very-short-patch-repair endonuclease